MNTSILRACAVLALGLAPLGCGSSDEESSETTDTIDTPPSGPSCGLNTGWAGDEYCIPPPPEGEGFQVHYGPSDYANAEEVAQYVLEPGSPDTNIFVSATSGNTDDIYFYKRQYRMRRGSHHLIVYAGNVASILGAGRRLGGSQNVVKDNPVGELPRENVGIGMPLSANTPITLNLHHFNAGSTAILREAWINFWYVDPKTVTQEAKEVFLWARGTTINPGERATVKGQHAIDQDGRILTMYGHRHSNNIRFSAYRVRDGNRELVYDDYDWEEPAVFEFNTLTTNPAPNPGSQTAGAYSGILDLRVGDTLEWECEIVNKHAEPITFGENEAKTSEMCILVGDAVGPTLMGLGF